MNMFAGLRVVWANKSRAPSFEFEKGAYMYMLNITLCACYRKFDGEPGWGGRFSRMVFPHPSLPVLPPKVDSILCLRLVVCSVNLAGVDLKPYFYRVVQCSTSERRALVQQLPIVRDCIIIWDRVKRDQKRGCDFS